MKREWQRTASPRRNATTPIPGLPKVLSFAGPKGTTIELFREWSSVGNGQQVVGAAALKLGHVAFVVQDPKPMVEFYGKVLGFRVSDWIGDFFVFMRCNADHHAVNFIVGKSAEDASHRLSS